MILRLKNKKDTVTVSASVPEKSVLCLTNEGGVITLGGRKLTEFGLKDRDEPSKLTHIANILKYLGITCLDSVVGAQMDLNSLNKAIELAEGFKFIEVKTSNKNFKSVW